MRTVFIFMYLFKNKQIPIPRTYKQVYLSFSLSPPPSSLSLSLYKKASSMPADSHADSACPAASFGVGVGFACSPACFLASA